jgi:catechol 2,3-dioxygenase-like lactoylglutathione lyase family enzyme
MTLKLSHTFMIVDDQDKALAFYRDVLGLELKNDVPLGDERWLTVASPEQPDVEIVLVTASMGHSPQDAEALSALLAKGVLGSAIFATDDLAATFERLRTAGAEVLQEPIDQPYPTQHWSRRPPWPIATSPTGSCPTRPSTSSTRRARACASAG